MSEPLGPPLGPPEGMHRLAELMIDAGCEVVFAVDGDGRALLMVGDGTPMPHVVQMLRQAADAIEANSVAFLGAAHVDVDDEAGS